MKRITGYLIKKNVISLAAGMIFLSLAGCGQAGSKYETVSREEAKQEATADSGAGGKENGAGEKENSTGGKEKADGQEPPVLRIETQNGISAAQTGQESENGAAGEKSSEEESSVSLLFAGDIYLSEHVRNAYSKAGGINGVLSDGLRMEIDSADLFMANEEFPFSDRGTQAPDKQFTFRLPTEQVHLLQEIGTDLVTLANNHALDFGTDALLDTCQVLDEAGILHVGAGENLEAAVRLEIVEKNGIRFGFLGASRVFPVASWAAGANHPGMLSAYDPEALCGVIREAKTQCDYLTVYVHWGIERNTSPESYQRTQGRQYIDAGADLVVGSHPHVLQGIEYYQGKPILYSLGNFIFGSSIPETMLVKVEVSQDGSTALSLIPATSSGGYTRELEEEKRNSFYQKLESLSEGVQIDETGTVVSVENHSP